MRFTKLRIVTLSLVLLLSGMAIFVVVSGMPPQINVFNPQNNQSVSGTLEIEAEVESRHPLCYVKVSFDEGVSWSLMEQEDGDDYFGKYAFTWNTNSLSDGDQKILVKTLDTFGRSDLCDVNVKIKNSDNSYLLYSGLLDVSSFISQSLQDTQDTQSSIINPADEVEETPIELEWADPLNNSFHYNTLWVAIDCIDPDSVIDTIWYRVINETSGAEGSIVIDNTILESPTYATELNISNWEDGSLYQIEAFGNTTSGVTCALSDEEAIFFSVDILRASFSHNPATQRVPNVPIPDEDIRINATISNNLDIDTVILVYSINGDWTTHNDSTIMTSHYGDNIYSGTIPGQDAKVYIEYYFYYNTTLGVHAVNDNIGQYYSFIVDPVNIDYISPPENNSWVSGLQIFDWDLSSTPGDLDYYIIYRNGTIIDEGTLSGGQSDSVSISDDTTLLLDGFCYNYTLWVNNTTPVSNSSSTFVYVDNQNPNLVFEQSSAYMNSTVIDFGVTSTLNISVQATDGISGVDTIIISHNATGTWQNYTMPANGTTNFYFNITDVSSISLGNIFMWLFYANDTAGVWQIQDNGGANYSIVIADLSGPDLIHTNDTSYLNDTTPQTSDIIVRFNATVSDNVGVESVFLCANATGSFANYTAVQDGDTWYYDLDIASVRAGEIIQYYWFANDTNAINPTRYDNGGSYWWFGYFVDDESPQLTHANDSNYLNDTTPETGDAVIRINATVTDNEGVESVFLCANATGTFTNYTALQDGDTWYYDLDIASVRAGEIIQYYWFVNDTNVANPTRFDNAGLYWWFGYFVDNVPPVIVHNQGTDVNDSILTTSDTKVRINATVTDDENVVSVFLCENSTSVYLNRTMIQDGNIWYYDLDISGLSAGTIINYYFYANDSVLNPRREDNTGNEWQLGPILDDEGPIIVHNQVSDVNDSVLTTSDTTVRINATVTDDESNVVSVFLCENSTSIYINQTMTQDGNVWYYDLDISGLSAGTIISYFFYANDSVPNQTREDNGGTEWQLSAIFDDEPPQLVHVNDSSYLNDTTPTTSDKTVRFNATVTDNEGIDSVFLCANVTGVFANYTAIQDGATTTWYFDLDVSNVRAGEIIQYFWYVNDTNSVNPTRFDNTGLYWWFGYFVDDKPPVITHDQITDVNDSILTISDTKVRINATVTDDENVVSVFLCENSTSIYINRTMIQDGNTWYYDLDISGLSAGIFINYFFFANDSVPNQTREDNGGNEWQIGPIYDDTTPLIFHSPVTDTNDSLLTTSDTTVRINATIIDNEGVIAAFLCENSTSVYVNRTMVQDGDVWYYDLDISGLGAGTIISYFFFANDSVPNQTREDNGGIEWQFDAIADDEPPIITHSQITDVNDSVLTTSDTIVRINATVSDNENVVSVFLCENSTSIYINQTMIQDGNTWYYDLDISGLSAGTIISYFFFANDSVPNQTREDNGGNEWQLNAIIDDESPQLVHLNDTSYLNDTDPQTSDTVVRFNATVTDNEGIDSVFLCANVTGAFANYTASQDGATTTWYVDLDVSSVGAGKIIQYYWFVNDTNAANPTRFDNTGLYWWFGYFVDNEPPQLIHANDSNYLNDTSPETSDTVVRFNATVTDNEGIDSVFLCANVTGAFANYTATQDGITTTWYFDLDVSSVGAGKIIQYYWYVNDTNAVNPTRFDNTGLYWWFGYFVDDEPPVIAHNLGTDVNDSVLTTSDTTVRINATVTDNENVVSVFLCENSTSTYINRTMTKDGDVWYYDLDISGLSAGTIISYFFYANDSVPNQIREDNAGNEWQLNAIIDDEPPQLVHVNDSNYLTDTTPQTSDNVVRFNATVTDNEGIESVFLCANVTGSFANYTALQDGITTTWYVDLDVSTVHMDESIRYYWYANDSNAANPSVFDNAGLYWWFGPFNDDEPPNLSYTGPQNGSWVTSAVNLYWTVIDEEAGVDRWELWRNDTLENSASGPIINFLYIWDELEEGKWYNFTLWANDTLGYERTLYIRLGVDSLPPTITLESPVNNSYVEHNDIIDLDVQDNFSGLNLTWYNWNGGTNTTFSAPWQIIIPVTLLEGPNYLYIFANDTNSNFNSTVYVFVVDNLFPAVTEPWTQFTNNTSTNADSLTVDIDYSDAYFDYAWFRVVNSTDLSIVQGDTNYTDPINRIIDISGYSDGVYRVDFWVNDTSGHTTYSYQFFEVDKTLPIITLNNPANNSLIEPGTKINLEIFDPNHPGGFQAFYNWDNAPLNETITDPSNDIPTAGMTEGIHDLYIYANDTAGNWAILHLQYDFDLNEPQVVLNSPNNDTTISGGTLIDLTISDLNLAIVLYNWDGTPNNTLLDPWDIQTTLSEGWHDLTIYANDSLGHTNTTYLRFYITYLPVINYIAPPANGSWVNNIKTLTWDCSDDTALSYYRVLVNGTKYDEGTLTGNIDSVNYNLDTTFPWVTGDILNITLWVNDTSNQFSVNTIFLRVDNTDPELPGGFQPQLSVSNPDDNDDVTITIPDPIDLSINAVYLNYTTDGQPQTSILMQYGNSYSGTIPAQDAGTDVVYFFHIFDSAGNDLIVTNATYAYTVAKSGGGGGGGGDGGGGSSGGSSGGGDGDTTPENRLYILLTLASSVFRQGAIIKISTNITDASEKGVEGVTVIINIGNKTWVTLEDLGGGIYETEIDTSNIDTATYLCIITAEKNGFVSASRSFVITIQPALPETELLVGMGGLLAVICLAGIVYSRKRRRLKSAETAREGRDYETAVRDFIKVGKIEEAAETCLVAESMYIDLAKLVEEKISLEKAVELWFNLGEKYRRVKSYVLAERAYRLAETYETAGKMYFDYAVELLMKKNFKEALNNVRKAVTLFTKAKDREKQSVAERYLTAITSLLTADESMEAGKYADASMVFSTLAKDYKDILPIEYLRSREAEAKMYERQTSCVKCGFVIPEEADECPNCGQKRVKCIICGLDIQSGEEYIRCPYCKVYGHKDLYLGYVRANDRCPNCKIELNENNVIKDKLDYQILDYIGDEDKKRVKFSEIAAEFGISAEEAESIIQILVDKNYLNGIFSKDKGEFVVVKIRTYSFEE